MKPSTARALAVCALLSCSSCGPGPAPDRGPAAPLAIGVAAPSRPAPATRPEAGPRAPDDLALLVRVADPEALAREVISILPAGAAPAAASLDPAQLLMLLLGKRLGSVVDLSQSIDIASVGKGDPSFVVSMAVKQEAEAKLAEGLVLREEGGLLHIGKLDDSMLPGKMSACAFTAAVGRATTRLVCASDEASLTATAPYLARNVAGEPLDADARVSVPGKILREHRDSTAKAIGDAASAKLGNDLVERFLDEIERIDGDLRFAGPGIEIGLDLRLAARNSMLARVLVPASKPAVPPPSFFRLPADSILALHTTGALPEDIAPLRKALADNIEGTLVQDGYQAEKTRALRERIEGLLLTGGPLVVAAGVAGGREGADRALAALETARAAPGPIRSSGTRVPQEARAESQARSALMPWMMLEVEEPAEKWTQGLRDIVRRAEDADKTRKPGSKSTVPHDPDGDHVDVRVGALDPSFKLPKDSLHLEVLMEPYTKGARPTRKAHVFVVPKGGATWIGYCEDSSAIASRLRIALDDSIEVGTLARSTDAVSLRKRAALGAGIVALGGLGYLTAKTTTLADLRTAASTASRNASRGALGSETVTWTLTGDTTPGSVRVSLLGQTTRQTAADALRLLGL
jgi:hypothetical protein